MDHLERARREEETPLVAQSAHERIVSMCVRVCAGWVGGCG